MTRDMSRYVLTVLLGLTLILHASCDDNKAQEQQPDGSTDNDTTTDAQNNPDLNLPQNRSECLQGPTPLDALGSAPEANFVEIACLEIRNDLNLPRQEIAYSSIPLPRGLVTSLDGLVVVGPDEQVLPTQLEITSRWGAHLGDENASVRWLQIAVPATVESNSTSVYSLRRYEDPTAVVLSDPSALTVALANNGLMMLSLGDYDIHIDPTAPDFLRDIVVATSGQGLLDASRGSGGPQLVLADGTTLGAADVTLDGSAGLEVVESGPVKVVLMSTGHFNHTSHPDVVATCGPNGETYARFGYTAVLTAERNTPSFTVRFHIRNECGDGSTNDLLDQAVSIQAARWVLPLGFPHTAVHVGGSAALSASPDATTSDSQVAQAFGGDENTWTSRRAVVTLDGSEVESGESLDRPIIAVQGADAVLSAQMPWMRFREPQAITARMASGGSVDLALDVVSEPLIIGEAKAIWGEGRIHLSADEGALEDVRNRGLAAMERGLLLRLPLDQFNASGVYPSLGTDADSPAKARYVALIEQLHRDTVRVDGQWAEAKTYGSQLWPDSQFDVWAFQDTPSPYVNDGAMNYWNPLGAELFEFFRTGDPKWVWDFALPQARLQMFSAYYNTGDNALTIANGFSPTSGGSGLGHWHRSAFGSNDYSYNQGIDEAFLIRPDVTLRERFRQAGAAASARFSSPHSEQDSRDPWVDAREVARGAVQRYDMIANCAEFVPGQAGQDCHDRIVDIMTEITQDNLRAGVICQPDVVPADSCWTPQQFMVGSMMIFSLHRHATNYNVDAMRSALSRYANHLWNYGIEKSAEGIPLAQGCYWAGLQCTFTSDGTDVQECVASPDSEGNDCVYGFSRPQTLGTVAIGLGLEPALGLCSALKGGLDDTDVFNALDELAGQGGGGGWYKPTAQMMQGVVFAVGAYDTCE